MRRLSPLWTSLVGLVTLTLVGCPRPLALPALTKAPATTAAQAAKPVAEALVGRVAHHPYQVQATLGDIAVGATVSLIDTQTNATTASTVTDADGVFKLQGLTPTPDRTYYLEATKGLPMGGAPNRAGFPGARVRTIVQYNSVNGWRSLSASGITLDAGTTALSVILSLRSALTPRPSEAGLLGSLVIGAPDVFTPGASNVSSSEYASVQDLATTALSTDNDPLAVITYDTGSNQYYLAQRGISVTGVSPLAGSIGSVVRVEGSSLSNAPIVRFNGVQATSQSVNSVQTVALVRVPAGATSGPLTLQVGALVYSGANFAVNNWDGHNVFDKAGNLYVAGHYDNAIWRFAPNGDLSMVASSSVLSNPRGIAVDAWDNLYVSSWSGSKIYKVTQAGDISVYATGGGLSNPWGLAINAAGDLFVANYSGHNVLKVASGSAAPITPTVYPSTGLNYPSRLAFDLSGYLYVTDWGNGTVSRIAPDSTTVTLAAGMSSPGGIALDGMGNVYVGAKDNSTVYKISPAGQFQSFASLPDYDDSVAFNPDGTLYVGSYYYHYVARLDSSGRVLNYLTPGHLSYSLKADSANNLYVTSGQGWGQYTGTVTKNAWDATSGTYQAPKPLITGLPNPSALAVAPNGDLFIGDWTGLVFKANPTTGSYASYMAGVGAVGDMAFDPSSNLYVASWGNRQVYKVVNGTITKRWGTGGTNVANIVKGPDGAFYLPDYSGNTILRLQDHVMSVYSNNNGNGFGNPMGCAFDSAGNLYVSGWNSGVLYKVATGSLGVSTYATGFSNPGGLACDTSTGLLYCADWGSSTIKKITPGSPATVATLATLPTNSRGLVRDASTGNVYAAGWYDKSIYRVTPAGAVASISTMPDTPWTLTQDPGGDLYVACYGNGSIQRIPVTGGPPSFVVGSIGSVAGVIRDGASLVLSCWSGSVTYRVTDGTNVARVIGDNMATPAGIVVDTDPRYVYVANWSSGCLVKVDTLNDTWAIVANSRDWLNGQNVMKGIAWGPDGKLYVQNWGGGTYQLTPGQFNPYNANGVSFYGGNSSSAGILGGIAFGPGGWLYGTSWTWLTGGSTHLVAIPPGGLGSGVAATRVYNWPDNIQF